MSKRASAPLADGSGYPSASRRRRPGRRRDETHCRSGDTLGSWRRGASEEIRSYWRQRQQLQYRQLSINIDGEGDPLSGEDPIDFSSRLNETRCRLLAEQVGDAGRSFLDRRYGRSILGVEQVDAIPVME